MFLLGFGEQVRGIIGLSRCVGAQGERFFSKKRWCAGKGTCELKVLRTKNVLVELVNWLY